MKRYTREPHYYELDKMGIMHHSNIIRVMEEARENLFIQLGANIHELENDDIVSPVTKIQCNFTSMIYNSAKIIVEIAVVKYTGILLELRYNIFDADSENQYATAQSQHCFLKKSNNEILEIKHFDQKLDQSIRLFMRDGYDE